MKKSFLWSMFLVISVYWLLSFPLRSTAVAQPVRDLSSTDRLPATRSSAGNADEGSTNPLMRSGRQATVPAISTRPDAATPVRLSQTYGQLPLSFEANHGQTDSQVTFLARGRGNTLFLTATEAILTLRPPHAAQTSPRPGRLASATDPEDRQLSGQAVLRLQLLGANPQPQAAGLDELPGKVHYFKGDDPAQWRTNIPTYAKVKYEGVYPGVDLIYYGTQRQLEYDFVVAPGADPQVIRLSFQGADHLAIDGQGDVVLQTAAGTVRMQKPVIYQEVDGVRQAIAGGYVRQDADHIGFQVGAYDTGRPLVIDPVLYATYLGGSGPDQAGGIAVDSVGNAYVSGLTFGGFPTTPGAFQPTFNGGSSDSFVAKLDATGSTLLYATYLGGSGNDAERNAAIAIDAAGTPT